MDLLQGTKCWNLGSQAQTNCFWKKNDPPTLNGANKIQLVPVMRTWSLYKVIWCLIDTWSLFDLYFRIRLEF